MRRTFILFWILFVSCGAAFAQTPQQQVTARPQETIPVPGPPTGVQGGPFNQPNPSWMNQGMMQGGQSMQMMPMRCGMGNMMGNMMSGSMPMNQPEMSHNMDQGLTMRDILYILSMQDALQVIAEVVQIQEKLMAATNSRDKEVLRKEMDGIKEKTKNLLSDYRKMISGQIRGDQ
ncbi:MAG: hypothetical protein ACE144_03360 [Thermodesulfobacteriota bacterium]